MSEWRAGRKTLEGYRAIHHKNDPTDVSLVGVYGMIYDGGSPTGLTIIAKKTLQNGRRIPEVQDIAVGEEILLVVPRADIGKWVKLLRVPLTRPKQVRLMENW